MLRTCVLSQCHRGAHVARQLAHLLLLVLYGGFGVLGLAFGQAGAVASTVQPNQSADEQASKRESSKQHPKARGMAHTSRDGHDRAPQRQ
jgi:hypothetical protein